MVKLLKKEIQEINQRGFILEKEIIRFKNRLNMGKIQLTDFDDELEEFRLLPGVLLSPEQNKIAIEFLRDKLVSPTGMIRKNNPFGFREEIILKNFTYCTLQGFYRCYRYNNTYHPIYQVKSDNGCFDYYCDSTYKINIIG
jgi:hypothetical protein